MEKSWITCGRLSAEYIVGVDKCKNLAFYPFTTVRDHLFFKGFDESYTLWTWPGETEPDITKNDIGDQANPQSMYLNQGEAVDMHDS